MAASGLPKSTSSPVTICWKQFSKPRSTSVERARLRLAEDAILASAEFFEVRFLASSEKMAQDVAAFAAIQNKIQIGLGHFASKRLKKPAPSLAMHGMTVDEDPIHVKDDATQLFEAHELSPCEIVSAPDWQLPG